VLGTLLHNGIPILQSLRISKDSTGNKVLTAAIEQSAENITGGDALAEPLRACKYFPRDIVEMIAVGEESNNLDKVLVDIANALEKRTSRQLDLFVPPPGAHDAAGHGRRHTDRRRRPAAARVQDEQGPQVTRAWTPVN